MPHGAEYGLQMGEENSSPRVGGAPPLGILEFRGLRTNAASMGSGSTAHLEEALIGFQLCIESARY